MLACKPPQAARFRLRQLREWRAEPAQPMRGPRSGRGRNDV
jgi:hypothetical protein